MAGQLIRPFRRVSTADTNAAIIKAEGGTVHAIQASNVNAAVRYLKLYDKATAPTVGTDVPVWQCALQGGATGTHTEISFPEGGLVFDAGISMALTTEATDAGTTGVSASEHVICVGYS
jgi:hypothetical protein